MDDWNSLAHIYLHRLQYASVAVDERVTRDDVPDKYKHVVDSVMQQVMAGKPVDLWECKYSPTTPEQSKAVISEIMDDVRVHSDSLAALSTRLRQLGKAHKASGLVAMLAAATSTADTQSMCELAQKISDIVSGTSDDPSVITAREAMARGLETASIESKAEEGIRTGWPSLDACYRVTPGSLLTLGAATNVGKSTVITSWLWGMAQRGTPVGIISVEDTVEDFGIKMLAAAAGVDPSTLWKMSLSADDVRRVQKAIDDSNVPLKFTWVRSRRLQSVLDRMDLMVRQYGVKVIAVDFLQAIMGPSKKEKRDEIDFILESMIAKAGTLNVGLVVASQLNRSATSEDSEGRARVPGLSALKESGTIENRSQCVVLLHRDKPTNPVISVRVAKVKRHSAGAEFKVRRAGGNGLLYEMADEATDSPW